MKEMRRIIFTIILIGALIWVIGSLLDMILYGSHFLDALIFDIPRHELITRTLAILSMSAFMILLLRSVNKRLRAEEKLRENEQRYAQMFREHRSIMLLIDPADGQIVDANPAACRFYGYDAQTLTSMKISQINMLTQDEVNAEMERAAKAHRTLFIFRHRLASGEVRDVEVRSGPVQVEGRTLLYSIIRDITERILAEKVRAQLASIVESSDDAIIGKALDGTITSWNAGAERTYGYTADEAIGQHIRILTPPQEDDIDHILESIRRGERVNNYETTRLHKDGTPVHVSLSVSPIKNDSGHVIGASTIARDITQTKETEEELRQRNLELVALDAITAAVSNSLEMKDVLQTLQMMLSEQMNVPGGAVFTLQPEEERLEMQIAWGLPESIKEADLFALCNNAVVRQKEVIFHPDYRSVPDLIALGLDIERPDWLSHLCIPLIAKGEIQGVLMAFSCAPDVFTNRQIAFYAALGQQVGVAIQNARMFEAIRQQREMLAALNTRLEEAETVERRRLSRELHDLVGQSLTALGINFNIIRSQISEEKAQELETYLDDSAQLIKEITRCVREVMDELRSSVLDDYGLVAALHWHGTQFANRTGIDVSVQGEDPEPELPLQTSNALFRIAQEALNNVAKHAQAESVAVTFEQINGIVKLTVEDDGLGFDPVQTARVGDHHGWGLITMTERADALRGQCRIESERGKGTRITVEVPR
jgi:PAS domain S-box-containing protein